MFAEGPAFPEILTPNLDREPWEQRRKIYPNGSRENILGFFFSENFTKNT